MSLEDNITLYSTFSADAPTPLGAKAYTDSDD